MLAGQVGVADHVVIGSNVVVGAQSGVPADLPSEMHALGSPAIAISEQLRVLISIKKLPELREDVKRLKKQLDAEKK